jgi:putative transcriptional regulator
MAKKRSKILDAVHETAKGLHAAGVIDQVTMRKFDQACLSPVPPLTQT